MVVQGTFFPYAVLLACLDKTLHVEVGENLEEEDATEQGKQQLLVHDDGGDSDDAANGEAARVAHENLGREGVEPQEADERTDKSGEEDHDFFAT